MNNTTTTGGDHEIESSASYSHGFTLAIIVFLGMAAVIGFIGNALVVVVIFRAKKLRSVMNRFVLHLAISDLIVCSLCIPLFLVVNFKFVGNPTSSRIASCKLTRFLQYLAPEASMTLLITIGLNRHRAVVHPLHMMTYSTANKLIFAAWLYAIVVVTPSLYLTEVKRLTANSPTVYCATIPATTLLGRIYVLFLGTFGYLIPLTALVVLYGKIYKTVWLRQKNNLGQSIPVKAHIQSRKKVLKMFLTVILMFLITWLPLIIYIGAIESTIRSPSHTDHVRLITYSVGLCNSICNPFIYALFNPKFRAECKDLYTQSFRLFTAIKSRSPARAAELPDADAGRQNGLARRGGFRGSSDKNSKKTKGRERKSRSPKPVPGKATTIGEIKQFHFGFKQQGFAVIQHGEHRIKRLGDDSENCVELRRFQTTALANDVGVLMKQTEPKLEGQNCVIRFQDNTPADGSTSSISGCSGN